MRRNLRGLTLAAVLLSASSPAQAENNEHTRAGDLSAAFAGDLLVPPSDSSVGDLTPQVGDLLRQAGDVNPESAAAVKTAATPASTMLEFPSVELGELQPTGFLAGETAHSAAGCDWCTTPGCDGAGCDAGAGCDSTSKGLLNLSRKDGWIRAEAMLMFMAERDAPPLVTSAPAGQFPVLPNATIDFGDGLDGGLSGGFRGDIGRYLTESFGIGGRFLWVGENGDSFSASGDQTDPTARSLGRPYFFTPLLNPGLAQEDSVIISQQNLFTGSVQAEFATDLLMADAYTRMTLCRHRNSRLEFLAGYTYAQLDDMISIMSQRTDTNPISNPTLSGFNFASMFDTENQFHGGQLGFESVVARGGWTARALTKVHLGNMSQTVTKVGTTQDLLGGVVASTSNSSILIDEEQGTESRDVFTFIPELDFTLGYRFRNHVSFTVGYTFLYFDNVAMAGDQIDRLRDTSNLGADVTPVSYDIVDGNHWVQGISLGASVDY